MQGAEVSETINKAYEDGELQKTPQYKLALGLVNNLPNASELSDEQKAQKAIQGIKNNIDPTLLPVGGAETLQAIIPTMKIPGLNNLFGRMAGSGTVKLQNLLS